MRMKEQNQTAKRYKEEIVPALTKEFGYKNVNESKESYLKL